MNAEGWYLDPYGLHEARWFSDGAPTSLVRDAGTESQDPPPDAPVPVTLEPVPETVTDDTDLLRADTTEDDVDDAVWDVFSESSGGD